MRSHRQPAGFPSQFPQPGLQVKPHIAAPHVATAFCGVAQTLPHEPQWAELSRAVSQPFAGFPSQSPQPVAHAKAQLPATQVAVAFGGLGHTLPQAPH